MTASPSALASPASIPASAAEQDGLAPPRRHVAIAAVLTAIVLVVMDGMIANVALPSIARAFQVPPSASVWVVTSYQLAVVMALLPCAALGESFGARRVFVGGVGVFVGASVLCALAPTLPVLAAARFLQGLGGAAIMALGLMLLRFTAPQQMLGRVIGWNAMAVALSSAAGPGIGAAILSVASWPWLFAVNLPVGALVLLFSRAQPRPEGTGRPLDPRSAALNAATFALIFVGADMIGTRPLPGVALMLAGTACLVLLVQRERGREAPLVPIDLLRSHPFRLAATASVCCFAAQTMSYVALPFYLQHQLGLSTFATGVYMTPWPLAVAVAAPVSGRFADRLPTAVLCASGALCMAVGLLLLAGWPLHGTLWPLVLSTILAGVGFGFFQTPNNRALLLSAPKARSGAAGGMQGTARLAGQTAGAVGMALLFRLDPFGEAPRVGLVLAAGCAVAAGAISALRAHAER